MVDNLKALDVIPKLTTEILDKIEGILQNKPAPPVSDHDGVGLRVEDADLRFSLSLPSADHHSIPTVVSEVDQ